VEQEQLDPAATDELLSAANSGGYDPAGYEVNDGVYYPGKTDAAFHTLEHYADGRTQAGAKVVPIGGPVFGGAEFNMYWRPKKPESAGKMRDAPLGAAPDFPSDPVGRWPVPAFFRGSRVSYKDYAYGCGGVAGARAGLNGDIMGTLHAKGTGIMAFETLQDAIAYLRDKLGGKGLIVGRQSVGATDLNDDDQGPPFTIPITGVEASRIAPASTNFATLLGTADDWYWEDASGPWFDGRPQDDDVIHSKKNLEDGGTSRQPIYTVYFVIPEDTIVDGRINTPTRSPIPTDPVVKTPQKPCRRPFWIHHYMWGLRPFN